MSILIESINKKFDYYVEALRGQFGNSLDSLVDASNKELFSMRRSQTDYFRTVSHDKINIGRFYLINYNYNGNTVYCPILAIDYRVSENNKHNLYAVNLDYLPFDYKYAYFNSMYNSYNSIFEKNIDAKTVLEETPLPVNFGVIFNSLKSAGGYEFAITAFDINKITECSLVSTNVLYLLIHTHMRKVNIALMKENMKNYENNHDKVIKLKNTIIELEKITDSYDTDVKEYYKRLKQIESNYKLFQNG